MATYTKTTNFTAKDNLTSGDPAKVIKGSEFDTEFNAIETAVNSKANANNGTHTGTTTISTADIDNLQIDSVAVTATAAELNTLDGITASTAELNITDGLTATTAELNTLDGITSTTAELNKLDGFTGDVTDLNKLASVTATATEINVLDGSTATTADLNKLAGVTATSTELNLLDGVTATTAEINFVDGVTSNIQTQLNAKQPLDAQLTDIAGLTPTDGTFIVGNGTNFVAESGDTAIASLGITATATELNTLDGITASTAELNYTDGVTSNIQTQLDAKANLSGASFTGDVDVTGTVTADGLDVTGSTLELSTSTYKGLKINRNDANIDQVLYISPVADTVGSYIQNNAFYSTSFNYTPEFTNSSGIEFNKDGDIYFRADSGLTVGTDFRPTNRLRVQPNGDVHLYEDTGTTAKFVWDSSAESLNLGSASSLYESAGGDFFVNNTNTGADVFLSSGRRVRFNTAGTERMRIDSSGRVGIGTASPSVPLQIQGDGNTLRLDGTANTSRGILLRNAGTSTAYLKTDGNLDINCEDSGRHIAFKTADTERTRIDSNGNLLVGKTSDNPNTQGVQAYSSGILAVSKDSGRPLYINRNTTDGALVDFVKDGLTVGSIGAYGSTTFIQSGSAADYCGVLFNSAGGTGYIQPTLSTGSSGADPRTDNAVSLGNSSHRFKDLYLSGGVYLGGTGSANKLDDYETGNFSPNALATFTVNNCSYTKIGRMVMLNIDVECPISSSGTAIQLGIPFTPSGATYNGSGTISYTDNRTDIQSFEVQTSSGRLQIRKSDENIATFADCSGYRVIGSVIYEANA